MDETGDDGEWGELPKPVSVGTEMESEFGAVVVPPVVETVTVQPVVELDDDF